MAWLKKFREEYKVENVIEGTDMEAHAEKLKFGLYVIRDFYSQKDAAPLMDDLSKSFDKLSDHWGEHSVRLGGKKNAGMTPYNFCWENAPVVTGTKALVGIKFGGRKMFLV